MDQITSILYKVGRMGFQLCESKPKHVFIHSSVEERWKSFQQFFKINNQSNADV
jgi:hypothetical protein